jgi:DNA polymerase delta subunit 1
MASSWEVREPENCEQNLIFQTLDWYCDDFEESENLKYIIYVFGVSDTGNPVTLKINDYCPFFFIEIPITWTPSCIYSVKQALKFKGKDIAYLERKRYYGFENNKLRHFLKLSFYNSKTMRALKYQIEHNTYQIGGKEYHFDLYESNIDPILRFTHLRDILTAGWIKVSKFTHEETFECNWKSIEPYDNGNKMSDIRVMYFDIEACSEDGAFPNALNKNDPVTQICCIYKDSKGTKKFLFNLGTIDPIEDTVVLQYPSEKKLLLSFAKFINDTDPDIIVGYNIFGFDNGYLFERAQVLDITEQFNYQSKLPFKKTEIVNKVLNNQQSGFNDWKMTKLYGRTHIDLLQVIKKDFKLESYKLDYVGEHFLKQGKDDVTPKEIFEAWTKDRGSREKRTRIGKYCVQDTNLCLLLFEKFAVLPNHLEMAKVTRVPLEYLITRGQSIKVFSQIAYATRKAGYLIPVLPKNETEGKFQGATVLEANIGYYTRPVCGLDFASLYPSIMIAHNMCYSTIVLEERYLNLPGVIYSTIDCGQDSSDKDLSFTFVQNQDGVLSGILQSLWQNRKATKKEMNASPSSFIKTVLNAKQLAIKVSMNSIYGFTGATIGSLPCLEISQSVTGCGREMIEQTQKHAKEMFQCEIVYGDSVTGDTPVLIKTSISDTIKIEDLFRNYQSFEFPQFKLFESGLSDKEQSIPNDDIKAWTASGWSPIKRIIRHHCNKKIYRVITPTGIVDVTEDHSLLDENLVQIKPSDLQINQKLLSNFPNDSSFHFNNKDMHLIRYLTANRKQFKLAVEDKLEANKLYIIGRFLGYGVTVSYHDNFYYISYFTDTTFNNFKNIIEIIELPPTKRYVYDIETEDGTFQAGIGQLIVKNTDSCYVIFPEPVDADGTLTTLFKKAEFAAKEISKTFKKPIELEFEKYMFPLILVAKKRYMYLEWTKPEKHNGEIEAKGVELVRRDNCPYVKETLDAVLTPIMFENNLNKGKEQAEIYIDRLLNGEVPIKKLILSKNLRNDYKGFEKKYLQKLLDGQPDKHGPYVWIHTKEIREKEEGKSIKTGKFEKIEECPTMAHVALVEKMRKRDPNSAPKPGDRIPFVYVDIGDPKALSWKKTEDPEYVIENKIPIDTLYYLDHQLKNPLKTIFDILLGELKCEQMFNRPSLIKAKQREKISIGEAKRKKEGNKDIRGFFNIKI